MGKITTGCSVVVEGPLVKSQGGKQAIEVAATKLRVVGECPGDTYPLAKKRHSLEYLRTLAHLRPRTNTIAAVARVRSQLAGAIHAFFQQSGFVYVQTPLITASDCEGAGELFRVTTLDIDKKSSLPMKKTEDGKDDEDAVDSSQDFFGKPAYLTVSGQLGGETYASAMGDIYTFGPTFRAENSQTTRHLAGLYGPVDDIRRATRPRAACTRPGGADLTTTLRHHTSVLGPSLGFLPSDVSVRSLRAAGANALLTASIDSDIIRIIGRWRSDEMLRYLHVQNGSLMAGYSRLMLSTGDYNLIPNQLVPMH